MGAETSRARTGKGPKPLGVKSEKGRNLWQPINLTGSSRPEYCRGWIISHYLQSCPHDLPRMTSQGVVISIETVKVASSQQRCWELATFTVSIEIRGWMISYMTCFVRKVNMNSLTKVKSLRQACRKLAAHYLVRQRNLETAQCTATVCRKLVAHRTVHDNCALQTCGAHCVPEQCATIVRCKLTCTVHIVYQNSARQLCRGVGSIFRLRGHQKCKLQIESTFCRSRNLITKWKYKLEDILKLNHPPPLLKRKMCFRNMFCKCIFVQFSDWWKVKNLTRYWV